MTEGCGCTRDGRVLCFYHKLHTIQFAGGKRSPQSKMESEWDKDMPAYQRLRRNGLQPKQINGCAEIEKTANSQLEVEMGDVLKPLVAESGQTLRQVLPKVAEGMAMARDMEWKPSQSVDARKDRYNR